MQQNFRYDWVPVNFSHCMEDECPLSKDCLRSVAFWHVPADIQTIRVIHPQKTKLIEKDRCSYFLKIHPIRYGKGFKPALDILPAKAMRALRDDLIAYFSRSKFYRCLREERLIEPEEQKAMQQIFEANGFPNVLIGPPAFTDPF